MSLHLHRKLFVQLNVNAFSFARLFLRDDQLFVIDLIVEQNYFQYTLLFSLFALYYLQVVPVNAWSDINK